MTSDLILPKATSGLAQACWLTACLLASSCGVEPGDSSPSIDSPSSGAQLQSSSSEANASTMRLASKCERHADCESLVCDTYAAAGRGRCIRAERVLYVSADCAGSDAGTGTLENPFCQIREAVEVAESSSKDVIRVMPGFYLPFAVRGQRLAVFGPAGEGGIAQVFEEDSGAARASDGADVLIDGFALGGPTHSGLICDSASAVIRRSTLRSDVGSAAVVATGCELHLDRADIRTHLAGLQLTDTRFEITNTFVTGATERTAVILRGGEGSFRFVTVTGNHVETSALGPFDCGSAPIRIEDSIVVDNRPYGDTGSQFRGACVLERVVVGDDTTTSPGAIHQTPIIVDGYRLPYNPTNLESCIDQASPGRSIRWDIEGTARPQGGRADIGAYEVMQ